MIKENIKLFPEQQFTYDILMQGINVYLSGEAGTGKSTVLRKFIHDVENIGKRVVVVAPTGIAAINVGGATAHRTFRAEAKPLVENPKSLPKDLLQADIFIIEEISMCRVDLFDWISFGLFAIARKRKETENKSTQIILCGDFFQLPPVITQRDREVLETKYPDLGRGFAFQSRYWKAFNFQHICLTQVIRQSDEEFIDNLNKARIGNTSCISYFAEASNPSDSENAIHLCGRNRDAAEINDMKLANLKSKAYEFDAVIEGDVNDSDKMTDDYLVLKVGARVMTLINDSAGRYQNGSFGTVTKCQTMGDTPRVTVQIDDGEEITFTPHTWEISNYSIVMGKLERVVVGKFTQIPLKLAYAVTIHKSQGQTYDKVNLDPYCWDSGQLYVGLSRVRTIEGLHLLQPIKEKYLNASNVVKRFYRDNNMKY